MEFGLFSGTEFNEKVLESELCALGREGWELASMFDIDKVKGGSKYVIAVLKKQLIEPVGERLTGAVVAVLKRSLELC